MRKTRSLKVLAERPDFLILGISGRDLIVR